MSYVDGYVIPIAKKKVAAYKKMAQMGYKMWMKFGALDYKECVGDDLNLKWGKTFPRQLKLKPGETVIFAYIVYKSRADRDRINAKVMKSMDGPPMPEMPFDMRRMVVGGFKTLVGK